MAITSNATTLTFNNGSTQTVAPVNTNANVNSVSAGSGISVSATTGALTVTNSGVTSVSAGSGISVSASTGGVTITNTLAGGVTSLNGQTGAITNTTNGVIGAYFPGGPVNTTTYNPGDTVAGSSLRGRDDASPTSVVNAFDAPGAYNPSLSGTWRAMGKSRGYSDDCGTFTGANLWVRVS
jgi:hypothetical protein